jgi:DNA-binding XRE family transcriptional regulator
MKPQNLIWDEAIYPRSAVNRKTVEAYVEALSIGARFPAVKVQQVVNYTPGGDLLAIVLIIIDGVHRWFAFTEAGRTHIPVIHYQDRVLDYEAAKTELLLESAQNNTTHGDRLTIADKKRIARDIATSDPDHTYTDTALAEKLGVSRQAVNTWITDIRARQKTSRTGTIIRLHRLGWTQENISTRVGLSRRPCPLCPEKTTSGFLPGFSPWPMNTPGPAPPWRFSMPTGATLNPPRQHKKLRTMP